MALEISSPDSSEDGFVLRSGPRSGLKREFAFALKAQSQFSSSSLGRTRSRKIHEEISADLVKKRLKISSDSVKNSKKIAKEPDLGVEVFADPISTRLRSSSNVSAKKLKRDFAKISSPNSSGKQLKSSDSFDLEKSICNGNAVDLSNNRIDRCEELKKDLGEVLCNGSSRDSKGRFKSFKNNFVETLSGGVSADLKIDGVKEGNNDSVENSSDEVFRVSNGNGELKNDLVKCASEEGSNVETTMMVDNNVAIQIGNTPKNEAIQIGNTPKNEKSLAYMRRFTRSVLNVKPPESESSEILINVVESGVDVGLEEAPVDNGCEKEAIVNEEAKYIGCEKAGIVNEEAKKNGCEKVAIVTEEEKDIGCEKEAIVNEEAKHNGCENEAIVKEEEKGNGDGSPLRSTAPNKKLELKMSKKIAMTKFPNNVRDLLGTGMLEGVPVKYIFHGNKEGLKGTIKDGGILCFCTSCKGSEVLTAIHFERHAGSLNKRAPEYIYLENGNTLRNVLDACKNAPLDMLEATIQSAISSLPVKKASICQSCRESFHPSPVGASKLLCNACLGSKRSHPTPASDSSARTPASDSSARSTFGVMSKRSQPTPARDSSARSTFGVMSKRSQPTPASDSSARTSEPVSIAASSNNNSSKHILPQKTNGHGKLTRKDQRLHKLALMEDGLPDGTEVAYFVRGKKLLEGYKMGIGIFCHCCKSVVSPSQFEAHAGWASRRKPYMHIYTSNGVSLHELSVSLSKGRKFSASDNDDLCTICADGGNLLLCDGCPRAFHTDCVELTSIPRGKWYCRYCQNLFQKEKFVEHNANALAAGRISGVDPIEQISKRCIRIVKTPKADVGGCVLCRCHDFSKSGFGPRTVLLCDQCEKEFHVGCLKDHKMANLKELPKEKWFCCADCSRIHTAFQKLLSLGSEKLPSSISGIIKIKQEDKGSGNDGDGDGDVDVKWRVLSGKFDSSDGRLLLSKAVAIFHDCFDPIVDSTTGRDLIPSMVYGRDMRNQEFGGMYCAVLTVNSSVVSAGLLRVFGREVAELPLVATSKENQGRGYFQALFSCIERLLGFMNVRNLVLPAAEEAEAIWTKKFGFTHINMDQLCEYTKDSHLMHFQGTSMLHKLVPKCTIVRKSTNGS
ncbi:uncharacterized protein LOC143859371 isoform X2 [Tasmannia lanceolata]|uniref:uncharacterized protein LOC143859371 isoform X2 n=1 Tax=Tasmannia lanceolata TaxID=3420 RepID=UPI004062B77A